MSKIIAFASQKGGPGKTTLTCLIATYLYSIGKRVVVLDVDSPQHTAMFYRSVDVAKDGELFKAAGLTPYKMVQSNLPSAPGVIELLKENKDTDFIFIDLPGSLVVTGYKEVARCIDLVVLPCELSPGNFASAMKSISFFFTHTERDKTKLGFIWTKVAYPYNASLKNGMSNAIRDRGVHVFNYYMKHTRKMGDHPSTFYPMPEHVSGFVDEVLSVGLLV